MDLICQKECIESLNMLATQDRHSILIEGTSGCGKTYLARYFSRLLDDADFSIVTATVNDIRSVVNSSYDITNKIVFCIENLDAGVVSAAYSLLKFLEEPKDNVYVVVTCRNIHKVPETIVSRSTCLTVSPPHLQDLIQYAVTRNRGKYESYNSSTVWKACRDFSDVDAVLDMTQDQVLYYDRLVKEIDFSSTISNLSWRLGHYDNNALTPQGLTIRCILEYTSDTFLKSACIKCLKDMQESRIADHAIIAKFLFDCKYRGIA